MSRVRFSWIHRKFVHCYHSVINALCNQFPDREQTGSAPNTNNPKKHYDANKNFSILHSSASNSVSNMKLNKLKVLDKGILNFTEIEIFL